MTTTKTTRVTGVCPTVLELLSDGQHQGAAQCLLPKGPPGDEHRAHFTQRTGDVRDVTFADGDRYEVSTREILGSGFDAPTARPARATAPAAPMQITMVALEDLVESPFNKRRTWGDLKELAASMGNGIGILEPLRARPIGVFGKYELVFGHRRLRAAKLAKLAMAPVIVSDLADDVALEMQAIENLQRVDLHPLEEAEGFEQLVTVLHWSADDVAAKVGKSKAYVYARLKLCELGPEGRKLFADGEMSASVALYVARVPVALQEKCIKELRNVAPYDDDDDGPIDVGPGGRSLRLLSARQARDHIEELFMLDLKHAPFDVADGSLLPGAGTCAACPKRSGNQKVLFADVDRGDVCTDPTCFAEKRSAHNARKTEKLVAKGVTVLQPKRDRYDNVRPPSGFARLNDYCNDAGKRYEEIVEKARAKEPRTPALKELAKKTVMIGDDGKPIEIVRTKGLLEAAGVKPRSERSSGGTFDHAAHRAKRELEERQGAAVMAALVEAVELKEKGVTAKVLQLIAGEFARRDGYMVEERRGMKRGELEKSIGKLASFALAGVLVELAFTDTDPRTLAAACKVVGVDAAKVIKAVPAVKEAEPEPEAPAAAKKATKTKGRKK